MGPTGKASKDTKAGEKIKQVRKTVEKTRMVKRKNENGEEQEDEIEETYQEEIDVDAEGEQPEETREQEQTTEIKHELALQAEPLAQKYTTANPTPKRLEEEFPAANGKGDEEQENERRKAVQERRKTMTDAAIMKEEGWKMSEIWDEETKVAALYMAKAGAQGITNYIQKALKRATEEIDEKSRKSKEKQNPARRSWTTKKNRVPEEYTTPKRITQAGEIIHTTKKTEEEGQRYKEIETRLQKQIEELTNKLHMTDIGEDNAARMRLQDAKLEKAENMMKQQQKINEVMSSQVKYLMKAEIAEDRKKAERQAVIKGWVREIPEQLRDEWVQELLWSAGLNADKTDYKSEVLDIQHSSYKGFSNMSIITFREPWQTRKLIEYAKTKTLKFYIQEERQNKQGSSWDSGQRWNTGNGWDSGQKWDNQQWNHQQAARNRPNQGKTVYIKVTPQLSKFDRTQQLYLRTMANLYNLWHNREVKLDIDWKNFTITSQDAEIGLGKQLVQLVFSRDGEVGIFSEPSINDGVAELFHSAMNIANNGSKYTWERENEENQWVKNRTTGEWTDYSEIGKHKADRKPEDMTTEDRDRYVELILNSYPKISYSERTGLPWRPYFCTVPGDEFFNSLKEKGEEQEWVQESKDEWDGWKWKQQGSTFNWKDRNY